MNHTKKNLILIGCTVSYVVLFFLIMMMERNNTMNFNGVLQAIQFSFCLIMVCVECRRGIVISTILLAISMLSMLRVMIFTQNMMPLPGVFNLFIQAVTLILLQRQFVKREAELVTDTLTGFLNRRGLYSLLEKKVTEKKPFHVIYIELDNFKYINDQHGHRFGYAVLKRVGQRLKELVGDNGDICRMGGNEFVVILNGQCDLEEYTERMLSTIGEKITITMGGSELGCYLVSHAGVARFPQDATQEDRLMKCADIAMLQVDKKDAGKICFYHPDMEASMQQQIEMEQLIKAALEKQYFFLVYQPQYVLKGKKLRGFEALLRLRLPDGTMVSPGEFIPVAEKSDLILHIDDYVLRRAMDEFIRIKSVSECPLRVSVNVSAKNIAGEGFAEYVESILKEKNFPPQLLEIEITEYCLLESMPQTIHNIQRLSSLGVQFALDDFGTGYSSLSYLSKLPIDLLKVDRSLLDGMEQEKTKLDFVCTIISMGHLMECEVISEGVENEQQLTLLRENSCDYVQGFVWGKPMDYESAIQLVNQN